MASHGQGSISDLALYTSPSLPNISLGRPALANHHAAVNQIKINTISILRQLPGHK